MATKNSKIVTISYDALTSDKVCSIRRVNPTYVKDLAAIAKQEVDGGRDPIRVFAGEPFPRIIVRAMPLEPAGGKNKDGEIRYGPQRYGIVGGYNRWRAAGELRVKDLEVELREYRNDAEALSDAITDNLTNGLHLNKDDRDEAIRRLHLEYKVSQADLVKRFVLGKASISRICAKKQRKSGPRKKATKKKASGTPVRDMLVKPSGFEPIQYMKSLREMDALFNRYAETIVAAVKDRDGSLSETFCEFVEGQQKGK